MANEVGPRAFEPPGRLIGGAGVGLDPITSQSLPSVNPSPPQATTARHSNAEATTTVARQLFR